MIIKEMLKKIENLSLEHDNGTIVRFRINTSDNEENRPVPTVIEDADIVICGRTNSDEIVWPVKALFSSDADIEACACFNQRLISVHICVEGVPFFVERDKEGLLRMPMNECLNSLPHRGSELCESVRALYEYDYNISYQPSGENENGLWACNIICTQGNYRNDSSADVVNAYRIDDPEFFSDVATTKLTPLDDFKGLILDSLYETLCGFRACLNYTVVTGFVGRNGVYGESAGIVPVNERDISRAPFVFPLYWEDDEHLILGKHAFLAALSMVKSSKEILDCMKSDESFKTYERMTASPQVVLDNVSMRLAYEDEFWGTSVCMDELMHMKLAKGIYLTYCLPFANPGEYFDITKSLAGSLNITVEMLHEAAMRNTAEKYPIKYEKMMEGAYVVRASEYVWPEVALLYTGMLDTVSKWLSDDVTATIIHNKGILIESKSKPFEETMEVWDYLMEKENIGEDEFVCPFFNYDRNSRMLTPVYDDLEFVQEVFPETFEMLTGWARGE